MERSTVQGWYAESAYWCIGSMRAEFSSNFLTIMSRIWRIEGIQEKVVAVDYSLV